MTSHGFKWEPRPGSLDDEAVKGKAKRAGSSYSSKRRIRKPRVGLALEHGSVPPARVGWLSWPRPCFGHLRQAHQRMRHSTGLKRKAAWDNTTCANFLEGLAGLTGQKTGNRSRLILDRCAGPRAPRMFIRPTADGVLCVLVRFMLRRVLMKPTQLGGYGDSPSGMRR